MQRHNVLRLALAVVVILTSAGSVTRGHTPIASRYTYNEELFPIFHDRCGSCHVEGGVAPMSLLTYQEAYPWAQSIREEVLGLRMPPWRAEDGFGTFKNGRALSPQEMDRILEWSSGGYPRGPLDQTPDPVPPLEGWTLGAPGLSVSMAAAYDVDGAINEETRFFVLATGLTNDRWITAVDFQPGTPAIVRSATVYVDTTGTARDLDEADEALGFPQLDQSDFPTSHPLAVWTPGQSAVPLGDATAYRLPAGADLVVRIHYKKTWITEGEAFADRSTVGLYFADRPALRPVEAMVLTFPVEASSGAFRRSQTLERDMDLLAVLPEIDLPSSNFQVEVVRPDGTRAPLLLLREYDPAWPTRYWMQNPLSLPRGSRLEVTAVLKPGASDMGAPSLLAGTGLDASVRILLDFVAAGQGDAAGGQ